MTPGARLPALVAITLAAASPTAASADAKRPFVAADINAVKRLSNLRLSPDGRTAVYVERALAPDGSRWLQKLMLLDVKTMQVREIGGATSASAPAWSPRGDRFAYLLAQDGSAPQLFIASAKSGDPYQVVSLANGVNDYRWSHNGSQIIISSNLRAAGQSRPTPPAGVHIFTRAMIGTPGSYIDEGQDPAQLWLVAARPGTQTARQLTAGSRGVAMVAWHPGDRKFLYTVDESDEPYYGDGKSSLHEVDVASGKSRRLHAVKDSAGSDLSAAPVFTISPDGRRLAYIAGAQDAPPAYAQPDAYMLDIATGKVTNVTRGFDQDIERVAWRDNRRLLAVADHEATTNVVEIDTSTGRSKWLTKGRQAVTEFAAASFDANRLLVISSTPDQPPEIADIAAGGDARSYTNRNSDLRARLDLTQPEDIWVTASDGARVHALLQKPPGFDAGRRYPMIVWNHGGPFWLWKTDFSTEVLTLAGAGYLVLYPNPRGSQSYGQAFATPLAKKWPGGRDYQDMLEVVDLVAKRRYVDPTKIGIGGNSAGAIMTDWAISHTDRFAAAVSISTIVDFNAMWYLGDQPSLGPESPPPVPGRDRIDSALASAGKVRTPTLYMSGERDYRTPSAAGSELMFRALKFYRVPTALINFATAGHSIGRSDYIDHPVLKMRYAVRWFDRYLKGAQTPEFAGTESITRE